MTKVYNNFVDVAYEMRCFNLTIKSSLHDMSKLFAKCLISDTHSMSLAFRYKHYLHVSIAHSDLYAKKFLLFKHFIWNGIINNIEVSISFPQFKIVLKQYLLVNSLQK